ncbi:hypothetical protein [Rhodobacter sp. CZR27]|uniref:hypothetical protein n=1 Tax=Rhodobacter sp. CZR27 TaxID=2033869 RepID=UPI000BBEA06C|nr:hypothetical protein [Rhodobacter sp. CZR27]
MARLSRAAALSAAVAALCQGALASEVAIRTGEHPGFTRVVVEDPSIRHWQLGRTPEGYALRLSPGQRSFDLSKAFRLINRKRLASLRAASESDLHLGIGCSCHVEPVEVRPGVIVLDIHDGAAPPESTYERPLPPPGTPALAQVRPRSRPAAPTQAYDWRKADAPQPTVELQVGMNQPAVDAMRQSLVEQLSRGAAAGAVDFATEVPPAPTRPEDDAPTPHMQVLREPGFEPAAADRPQEHLTAAGSDCIADDRIDVTSWSTEEPVARQMATALAGLTGEFDDIQPEALGKAVRFYLSLGFGAEARQLLATFPGVESDRPVWDALARILDGERVPEGAFAGMATCDTAAALWSVLSDPPSGTRSVNSPAVLRTFSALPTHLRRHLGPRLAEDYMARGDPAGARAVQDAVLRAPGDAGQAAVLTEARLAVAEGRPEPLEQLASVSGQSGPTGAEALALLVERQVAAGKTPTAEDVIALAAMLHENPGSEIGRRLGRAYRLALAATGDFETAFARRDLAPEADADVWRLLADAGPDSELLAQAVLAREDKVPDLPVATRRKLADRLLGLGLAAAAERWLDAAPATEPEDRLLLSRIALQERDAAKALGTLAGLEGEEANRLRDTARSRLPATPAGRVPPALPVPTAVPESPAPLQTQGPAPAATSIDGELAGPLARSRALVEESASDRSRIEALLGQPGQ